VRHHRHSTHSPFGFSTYTGTIIAINVAFFIVYLIFAGIYGELKSVELFALKPSNILAGKALWTFLTSMFLHANLTHLFVNMISLMFIGNFVEKLIGKKRFLWFYLISGFFASLFFIALAFFTGNDLNVYAVGASGAIFGLGGLLAILTPRLPVLVFFVFPMPMWAAMIFLLLALWAMSLGLGIPIGNTAHLGGLLVGIVYGSILKTKYPRRTRMISQYFSR